MKHKGSVCDFSADRNEELRKLFKEELMKQENRSTSEAMDKVWQSGASRFYVSETRVKAVMRYRKKHGNFPVMGASRLRMFRELWKRYTEKSRLFPKREEEDVIYEIVNSPAPSFYLTRRSLRTLLYNIL